MLGLRSVASYSIQQTFQVSLGLETFQAFESILKHFQQLRSVMLLERTEEIQDFQSLAAF
jgi:hypothetical protein